VANATAQFVAQTQCATMWTSQIVNNHNTKADNAKSVATDTSAFSKTDTIWNLKALKEEERLELIDELFKEKQDFA